jgi:hypothetical protein
MTERVEVPFTNEFGQVIQPGDEVLVVTMCTKTLNMQRGTYLGLRNRSVQVRVPDNSWEWYNKETGLPGSYYSIPASLREYRKKVNATRISTLQLNRIYKIA